jgi:hypothetical protein
MVTARLVNNPNRDFARGPRDFQVPNLINRLRSRPAPCLGKRLEGCARLLRRHSFERRHLGETQKIEKSFGLSIKWHGFRILQ